MVASIFAMLMVTPTQAEYIKGLLRAGSRAMTHLSPWDDLSLNRLFLAILCAILLVTGTIIWRAAIAAPMALPPAAVSNYPMGIAMSVLVVAYFGLAMQYFLPRFGPRGKMYFGLFLFLAWIASDGCRHDLHVRVDAQDTSQSGQIIYSLSPIAGIATSSIGGTNESATKAMQGRGHHAGAFVCVSLQQLAGRCTPPPAQRVPGPSRHQGLGGGGEGGITGV